jgi:hypothetical protein
LASSVRSLNDRKNGYQAMVNPPTIRVIRLPRLNPIV